MKKQSFILILDIKAILDKELQEKYIIDFHSTTVFPRAFGDLESSRFPFGAFLGIAVRLRDNNE